MFSFPCSLHSALISFPRSPESLGFGRSGTHVRSLLTSEYAVAFVRGFERSPLDPGHIQASAACKHLAADSLESATEGGVSPALGVVTKTSASESRRVFRYPDSLTRSPGYLLCPA